MNEPVWTAGRGRDRAPAREAGRPEPANLADILERVLDKGIVIAGDIRVDLLDIELLTIKIRLIVASVDRAREMGIDWWEHDPSLSSGKRDVLAENRRLRRRIGDLEAERAGDLEAGGAARAAGGGRKRALEDDDSVDEPDDAGDEPGKDAGEGGGS
ncbi:gas vesicle protein [Streptomyces sp. HPF1205]|uniref:gas vesicle protein n=1 Tax=Streptomyces sp. HPF1205 TaxID=2873262 RepID=UPI001CECD048|nr:gas vesicle protein [Streptomyces sp. HPF1205]